MYILGLTGSLGMGKSTVAAMMRRLRLPVFEADKTIHALYNDPTVACLLALTFPNAVTKHGVDRKKIGAAVFDNPELRLKLTNILYPALAVKEKQFLRSLSSHRRKLAVLDIPLLFETGGQNRMDSVMVVDAPHFVQRQRALRRYGMTPQKLDAILATQINNSIKAGAADIVVKTGVSRAVTFRAVQKALRILKQKLEGHRGVWDSFTYARNRT